MIPLKDDGTLDVKFISILPHADFEELIGKFTKAQTDYFWENAETTTGPVKPVKVEYSLEDMEDWGLGFDADKVLNRMRKRIEKRKHSKD